MRVLAIVIILAAGVWAGLVVVPGHASDVIVYFFKGGTGDGANPAAGLIDVSGTLYGTTVVGGAHSKGTVFHVKTSGGKDKLLYSFKGGSDGVSPLAGLTDVGGTLYGTTNGGGTSSSGTVFKITTAGSDYKRLHSFEGGPSDGALPYAGLINVKGTLYGTTNGGGAQDGGTVFKIATAGGGYKMLYPFKGGSSDGANPIGGLVDVDGILYGTTQYGGGTGCINGLGCGTVFKLTPPPKGKTEWTEKPLYSFQGGSDGANPYAGLINIGDTLYGTTLRGGGTGCNSEGNGIGCGTVFKISTTGSGYKMLYAFKGGSGDGANPQAGLTNVNGTLYGTTQFGGDNACADGCGTVFRVTP